MEPRIKPFILNRTDERNTKSVGGILLYAALFFIVTRIAAMLLQKSGAALYEWGWGLDAAGMLGARTPESMVSEMGWRAVPHVLLLAPFVEECAFRLGLSFRRWHIAAGLGALAYFFADWMLFFADVANARYWALLVWIAVAAAVYGFTTDGFWLSKRDRWLRPAMWASTVVFASVHLLSVSALTWGLLPYALLYVLGLFFSGCVFVYLRVNLGFGWALGAHMLCNLPPALFLLGALCD